MLNFMELCNFAGGTKLGLLLKLSTFIFTFGCMISYMIVLT